MRRRLFLGALALASCIDFRGAIDARCANGSLECPDAGAMDGGANTGGGGVVGGGGATGGGGGATGGGGGGPPADAGRSCGEARCVFDGGSSICFNGWCWEAPLPQGNELRAVWGSAADDVWAAGAAGALLRWDGVTWTSWQGEVAVDETWSGLWGSSASSVWLVGEGTPTTAHLPQRFDGTAWRVDPWMAPSPPARLLAISGDDAGNVVAVGPNGLIATREAAGWRGVTHPLGLNAHATSVAFDAPGSCWVTLAGTVSGVARCDGGALDLVSPPNEVLLGLAASAPGELWAVGHAAGSGMWRSRSADGGWSVVLNGGKPLVAVTVAGGDALAVGEDTIENARTSAAEFNGLRNEAIWSSPSRSAGWVVGGMGEMARSASPGSWVTYNRALRVDLWSLRMTPQFIRACTQNGAVVFPNPSGPGWSKEFVDGTTSNIMDHWFTDDGSFGVLAEVYGILESRTPGDLTSYDAGPGFRDATAVWGSGRDDVWVASESGQTMHRTAAGWDAGFSSGGRINDIDGTSATRAWMVGNGGGVLRRAGDETWLSVAMAATIDLTGVWVPPPGGRVEAIAVGEGIYRYADAGWEVLEPASPTVRYEAVWGFGEDDFYVVGQRGAAVHYQAGRLIKLELGTRNNLLSVLGRTDAGVKELWVSGQQGTVLHTVVP